jgi:predicted transcriptional regulator
MKRTPMAAAPDETLADVAKRLEEGRQHSMPVIQDGRLVGFICDHDLRHFTDRLGETKVSAAMVRDVVSIGPAAEISEAVKLMRDHKITALPVVENAGVVGMLTTSDILEAVAGN